MIVVLGGISHIYKPIKAALGNAQVTTCGCTDSQQCNGFDPAFYDVVEWLRDGDIDLIIAAGWRHLIPKSVLDKYTVVGFHHAKLPEYPGRAPVPWTLLRGDEWAYTTLLYLDEGPDTGDVINYLKIKVRPDDTARSLYERLGVASAELLTAHLGSILSRTPGTPQDMSKRGPLTTADGWQRLGQSL